ncbi:hypothetical protein J2X31_003366 [Flavobacterium arsenatis]|uniref:DUF1579 domain-containing protein n=1 Tax=Flavobacterium arsenatis TaxID=1484332 RepID=A0ABU1TU16_9FLAO|nr:DUF1579 domain-containing protein [Flavobacterium arsenatis]MDR6969336.1 hypothetical protein [Flavobacterium arsenatis]
MKTNYLYLGALLLVLASCKDNVKVEVKTDSTDTVVAATPEAPKADSATVAKAWEAYMTPSKGHEMLAKDNGTWNAEMTFWSPDSPEPMKSTAVATYKMILGGKYQEANYTGDMMGMPFEGRGTVAYDNAKEKFISTWIDNMGTGMMVSEGTYDEASKTLTFTGNMVDPVTKKEKLIKEIITYMDNDTQKMEMFDVENGKEFKSMEIISKRKK